MSALILQDGPEAYQRAVQILRVGGLVALPTETVYGLAADARDTDAINSIYTVKGRPAHNPLITHLMRPEDASSYAELSPLAERFIAQFWPGPLTLVLPRLASDLSGRASAGLSTIALRCPDAPWRKGLRAAGWTHPLVMPSANLSGHVSPTRADHVAADLGEHIALIIDGGPCKAGIESTVIAVTGNDATLLRDGALARRAIEAISGPLREARAGAPIASPGQLLRHYAPEAALRLKAETARDGEILIGFGPDYAEPNLSKSGDLKEAAQRLYGLLRDLDGPNVKLAVAPIPMKGLGRAINDRLRRAARGR